LDNRLLQHLDSLEPFGQENPAPTFGSFGVKMPSRTRKCLAGGHLKADCTQGGITIGAIGFGLGGFLEGLPERVDIAYTPGYNTYRGKTSIQLVLKDVRPAQSFGSGTAPRTRKVEHEYSR
jgi:single-stranded-DNA-specific exonuclease